MPPGIWADVQEFLLPQLQHNPIAILTFSIGPAAMPIRTSAADSDELSNCSQ
jgi:hypothetical protein